MNLTLKRRWLIDNATLGELFIDGEYFCYTLEDKVRDVKIKGITAIPYGSYKVVIDWSSHFGKRMPHILSVPNFEGVRIHAGNTAIDTEGCILVGFTKGEATIGKSRDAYDQLFTAFEASFNRNEDITIDILKEVVL